MSEAEEGLYLRLRLKGTQVEVEAAAAVQRWSRALLRDPILTREVSDRVASPGAETVLCLLEEHGGILARFGFSALPQVFFDRKSPERRKGLAGKTGDPTQRVREIRVPLPGSTRFLCFYRSELRFRGDSAIPRREFEQECVALYSTARAGQPTPPAPQLPAPASRALRTQLLPWLPPRSERRSE